MGEKNPKVDAYIEKSQDFAKPILKHLRGLVHKACPGVKETIKWGMPIFEYSGALMCNMASFKAHCAFGFWKGALMEDKEGIIGEVGNTAMGSFGRITDLKDLPEDKIIIAYIKEAMKLNEQGVKAPAKKPSKGNKELEVPEVLVAALEKDEKAKKVFEDFSYSHKKEYVEWITEAKTEATRTKRLEQTIEMLKEGKHKNWKYERK